MRRVNSGPLGTIRTKNLTFPNQSQLKEEVKNIFGEKFKDDPVSPDYFYELDDSRAEDIIKTMFGLKKELDEDLIAVKIRTVISNESLYVFWETISRDPTAIGWKERRYAADIERNFKYQIPIEEAGLWLPGLRPRQ